MAPDASRKPRFAFPVVGMIERVALVKGTLMTETEPGKGTTIIACMLVR